MMKGISCATKEIDSLRESLDTVSMKLWNNPEVAYEENMASGILIRMLEEAGFSIARNIAGIPTAFMAQWGSGYPRIGFLAEYDALPGFSQREATIEEHIKKGAAGHGCGHNLIASAHLGAVLGIKKEMEQNSIKGTIVLFGCPAEEVLTGKVFMARAGAFNNIDCALNFHPGATNCVSLRSISGINSTKFSFYGLSAHAAIAPEDGRSASDAAELMNIGANYLREHIPGTVRMHYVTTNGGSVPNIVPNKAQTWYFIRAIELEDVNMVFERLVKVAKGAALMTETEVKIDIQGGCYPTLQNKVLGMVIHNALELVESESFSKEEIAFASELNSTCSNNVKHTFGIDSGTNLFEGVLPLHGQGTFAYNSSDIGDVGHIVPTVMFNTTCFNALANLHSWQVVACAGNSIGEKGMIYAAKTLAVAGIALLQDTNIIESAKKEFEEKMIGKVYKCPIPDNVTPPI